MPADVPTLPRASLTAVLPCFAAIYVIWGTVFLGIALMLRTMPPYLGGAARFFLAGGGMYLALRWREPQPFRGLHFGGTVLCGVLLTGMGNGFLIWAQTALPSGITSLFVGVLPVMILLLDSLFFSRRAPRPLASFGVLVGLAGVVLLALRTGATGGAVRPIHIFAVLGAQLAWALGTLLQPRYCAPSRVLNFTCLQMLAGAVFQLLMALVGREWVGFVPSHVSLTSLAALLYLAVFGSIIAFSCYAYLVAHVAPQKIATYALVNPVIALALGALVLGERITPAAVAATVLVLAGVALVLYRGRAPRAEAALAVLATSSGAPIEGDRQARR